MANKIAMRLQTPADIDGVRKDIHIFNTTDEVIADPDSSNPMSLTEKLDQIGTIHVSTSKPNFPCIWAKPID